MYENHSAVSSQAGMGLATIHEVIVLLGHCLMYETSPCNGETLPHSAFAVRVAEVPPVE